MLSLKDITRKTNSRKYYHGDNFVFELKPKLFYIEFADGTVSEDYFNETRAAEHGRRTYIEKHSRINALEAH